MKHPILGLHHVTATVNDAQEDLDFYLGVLGLRLVKRTINFDNRRVYHFYYGTEAGAPGTIWTTFPYKGQGVPIGQKGAGQITVTSFSVPAGSLGFWTARFREHGVSVRSVAPRFGTESLLVEDPSGLGIELRAGDRDRRAPWAGGPVGSEAAIRGLDSVTLLVKSPDRTVELMTSLLGFGMVHEANGRFRLGVQGDQPGRTVEIVADPEAEPARNGLGTVHHVALAIQTPEQQLRLRQELVELGYQVTEVLDRQYFRSIYFREPAGVLLEVATMAPGFTIDEEPASLGRSLKLPPWEEGNRKAIEHGLPIVTQRG